jgi:alkanesulfonate monooxygenase SsuD/methylene tetrahydromethanopterin reductase-like flavin-dependent oxidoreductase (luciferase family)
MEYFPNFNNSIDTDPVAWAHAREADGYDGVVVSDHFWIGDGPFPHVWVTLTQIACATGTLRFSSSFCNNLFRSPVEFAQASLALHRASKGRFEAGLGAGWAEPEITGIGWDYPAARDRAGMFIEALKIIREIFEQGKCQFRGDYYNIDAPTIGPFDGTAPLLVGSAGGPRTRREISPIVDRIEVFAGDFIRGGALDFVKLSSVTDDDVKRLVSQVKDVRGDLPISYFTLMAAGEGPTFEGFEAMLGDGFASGLVGHPEKVMEKIARMEEWGISRVQLTELAPDSYANLSRFI